MEKSNNRFYIRTYGCQMNKYDSDIIKTLLLDEDFEDVSTPEEANFVLINTCSVREHAEKRAIGRLNSFKGLTNKKPEVIISAILGGFVLTLDEKEISKNLYRSKIRSFNGEIKIK